MDNVAVHYPTMAPRSEPYRKPSSSDALHKVPSWSDLESGGKHRQRRRRRPPSTKRWFTLTPTTTLSILVFIDMFAVSLVVPLLFQYYRRAGVSSASQRELLSSVFSMAQILGGLALSFATDLGLVTRKRVLLLSFAGSAVSYAMIVIGGLYTLMISRILVGLVKQTMTISTTILTSSTDKPSRAKALGKLSSASTLAWIIGPSTGALLYRHVDERAPAVFACGLFVVNLLLATVLIVDDHTELERQESTASEHQRHQAAAVVSIWSNLRSCFVSKALGASVVVKLLVVWVTKATNYSQLGSFYEDMYGLQPHHRGYISSYQQLLQFIVGIALVAPVMAATGGERHATVYCVGSLTLAVFLESQQSLPLFLLVLCPIISLSFAISDLSLQSLVTHVAPTSSIFSVLAALDVLQNAVSVSVPFYRTLLFRFLPTKTSAAYEGDPDPVAWVQASAGHWAVASVVIAYLLLANASWWPEEKQKGG